MKRRFLLDYIIREKVFGRVVPHFCVNEFEKCGLVHSHIILILDDPSRVLYGILTELPNSFRPEFRQKKMLFSGITY